MVMRNIIGEVLGHKVKAGILRILSLDSSGRTGRELAKELQVSPTTAHKFLKELSDNGVINVKGAGNAYLYGLNQESHIAKNIIKPFFDKEKAMQEKIVALIRKALLKSRANMETAAIFGSVAKKTESYKSDIDLLVIIKSEADKKKTEKSLDGLSNLCAQSFQTVISPYYLSVKQFKDRYRRKDPLVKEILSGYILVCGKPLERMLI